MTKKSQKRKYLIFSVLCMVILIGACRKTKTLEETEKEENEKWGTSSAFYSKVKDQSWYLVFRFQEPVNGQIAYAMTSARMSSSPSPSSFVQYVGIEKFVDAIDTIRKPCVITIGKYSELVRSADPDGEMADISEKDKELLIAELKRRNIQEMTVYALYDKEKHVYEKIYPKKGN